MWVIKISSAETKENVNKLILLSLKRKNKNKGKLKPAEIDETDTIRLINKTIINIPNADNAAKG